MKIFISHQKDDSAISGIIAKHINNKHNIEVYLDVIDENIYQKGDLLANYIRQVLRKCTSLLAVVSSKTQNSWWVPWEIGIATEKDQPIATFTSSQAQLPGYLEKWPYLRTEADLDIYAEVLKSSDHTMQLRKRTASILESRQFGTQEFYRTLRGRLGQ
jgi:hypothetical protein